jgi:hypothetical protein
MLWGCSFGVTTVFAGWMYFDHKLDDQEQANQHLKYKSKS